MNDLHKVVLGDVHASLHETILEFVHFLLRKRQSCVGSNELVRDSLLRVVDNSKLEDLFSPLTREKGTNAERYLSLAPLSTLQTVLAVDDGCRLSQIYQCVEVPGAPVGL